MFHTDFGDNKFPYYKSNTNTKIDFYKHKNDVTVTAAVTAAVTATSTATATETMSIESMY